MGRIVVEAGSSSDKDRVDKIAAAADDAGNA
jgi:hypothetical protein